jgi:outer membrane protein assembly factor BamB
LTAEEIVSVDTNVREGVELLGYRLEAVLGLGGMGVVYRALDLRLNRRVALKLMAPDLAADDRFRERFARESELAMSLEHPNVIPIHDAGEVEGRLFLAMRHVEGSTLRALLRAEGALAPARALAIARQIANALDAAHASGLVHRDVKPSNVLLDRNEHVYLADFGLTRRLDEQGRRPGDNRSLGTPAYLAPEQIERGPVDGRADVYSLGCLLFECLTGEAPFARGSRLAVAWAHLEEEPPPASERRADLPGTVDGVLGKAMAKEPADRYATCGDLVEATASALGVDSPPTRRRPLVLAALAGLVAALAVAAGFFVRDDEQAAAAVKRDTVVRVDPETNSVVDVVDVGRSPVAAAVNGGTLWVFSFDGTVSEIDAADGDVRRTLKVPPPSSFPSPLKGPFLAVDSGGAWVVTADADLEGGVLTRVPADGGGLRTYRLEGEPRAVALGAGGVWVLAATEAAATVRRLDPRTGQWAELVRLPSFDFGEGGLAVAGGAVWAMDAAYGVLYRVDLRTRKISKRDLGDVATPPVLGFGSLWICALTPGSTMLRLDAHTGRTTFTLHSLPAEDGSFAVGEAALWRHDDPSGDVLRFDPDTGKVAARVRITPTPPKADETSLRPTAVAAGAGSVWVTVAQS